MRYLYSNYTFSDPTVSDLVSMGRHADREEWSAVRSNIFEEANYIKFTSPTAEGQRICALLLGTGDARLVGAEGDTEWGIRFYAADAVGVEDFWGSNFAGEALERVRERIRTERASVAVPKQNDSSEQDRGDKQPDNDLLLSSSDGQYDTTDDTSVSSWSP